MKPFIRLLKYCWIALLFLPLHLHSLSLSDEEFDAVKDAFELWGVFFREIVSDYPLDFDPMEFVDASIEGALSVLDPYTAVLDDRYPELNKMLPGRIYTYLGFKAFVLDGMITVSEVIKNSTAEEEGVKIGDIVYKIDSTIIYKEPIDSIEEYNNGRNDTKCDVWLLRNNLRDTIKTVLNRKFVWPDDLCYYSIYQDSIAYLKIVDFSYSLSTEARVAFDELKDIFDLKGLIIDLRDNGGGLLSSAATLCSLFVKKNTSIVNVKGKEDARNDDEFETADDPVDIKIPIAVLINGMTASASEVVAGALQDLDRAIILGEQSYGKGLVQTEKDLDLDKALIITVAKTYLPSGRCIQKLDHSKRKPENAEKSISKDTVFYTKNGRKVYGSAGIIPDSIIPEIKLGDFVQELIDSSLIFRFATLWAENHQLNDFLEKTDDLADDFSSFLDSSKILLKTTSEFELANILQNLNANSADESIKHKCNELKESLKKHRNSLIKKDLESLNLTLIKELERRYYSQDEIYKRSLAKDKLVHIASTLLNREKYNEILKNNKKDK
ncbi:MAG: PDZ domain-containing protein [Ignavibacteria bacterium]|jgi:carboxyl-terminal processing protease|nr:PDZ domain-containing protein [Ignavibacteria bacterium]